MPPSDERLPNEIHSSPDSDLAPLREPARLLEHVSNAAMDPVPAGETAPHLYRIAQEAMSHAVMHGAPDRINLTLALEREPPDSEALVLEIRHDGIGILEGVPEGVGLRNMRHRADIVDATLHIKQAEAGGTVVRCTVPLSAPFPRQASFEG